MIQHNLCMETLHTGHYIDVILYSDEISKFMNSLTRHSILLDESLGDYDFKVHVLPDKYLYMYNSLTDYHRNLIKLHGNIRILKILEVSPLNIRELDSCEVCSLTMVVMQVWKI